MHSLAGAAPARFQGDTKKKTLASLLAAATIALTLTATDVSFSGGAGDGGGDWALPPESSVRCDRRSHHRLPTTRLCGVPRLRTAGVRTRVLLGIPACLRRCRPRCRLYRPTVTDLPWLCCASAARRGGAPPPVVSRIFRTFDQATASVCMSCG